MTTLKPINYLYFAVLFIALSMIHLYEVILVEKGNIYGYTFYMIYAVMQSFLEVGVIFLLANYTLQLKNNIWYYLVIFFSLILLMLHIFDFPLVRFMDFSIWHTLPFILEESIDNFFEMLHASNISIYEWGLTLLIAVSIFFNAVFIFKLSDIVSRKKPWYPCNMAGVLLLASLLAGLAAFDYMGNLIPEINDIKYLKGLPWKKTFFTANLNALPLNGKLEKRPSEEEMHKIYTEIPQQALIKKPNIYLFIIESLRNDYMTKEISPNIAKFREENIAFDVGFSSANVTVLSWFSLFHSKYPFYWGKPHEKGSLPLKILKDAGYQTNVYTSARLSFYGLDKDIFGINHELADSIEFYPHDFGILACESDAQCFQSLKKSLNSYQNEEGHFVIVFLDATHFGYSWPEDHPTKFNPVNQEIDYWHLMRSKNELESVKNRYRNAIHYVDGLFGDFYKKLLKQPNGEDAIVIVTGDHGEEFYEENNVFHMTHLSSMQTEVPIYYRFGTQKVAPTSKFTAHIDIFPSVFHYLFNDERYTFLFNGESIFRNRKNEFAIATRFNFKKPPFEFFVHNGEEKLIARFDNESDIFESKALKILCRKNIDGEHLDCKEEDLNQQFGQAIKTLFPATPSIPTDI